MIKQIICTIIILLGISIYIVNQGKKELIGNVIATNQQTYEGQKAGTVKKPNIIKWVFNKDYRRGYILGVKK